MNSRRSKQSEKKRMVYEKAMKRCIHYAHTHHPLDIFCDFLWNSRLSISSTSIHLNTQTHTQCVHTHKTHAKVAKQAHTYTQFVTNIKTAVKVRPVSCMK